jgi:hypothetical protein
LADGSRGLAQCIAGHSASVCSLSGDCQPGAMLNLTSCYATCAPTQVGWQWNYESCGTPLVLSFDAGPAEFTRAAGEFDLLGAEASIATHWVSARTPWLAIDRDRNGRIDDGRELFGSMTELPTGRRASNGFEALAALDDNGDGLITTRDAAFGRLLLWSDGDQDRRSSSDELMSADNAGLVAIRLDYQSVPRCTDGDCEIERATFIFRDGHGAEHEGAVVDVHLAPRR